jgi:hypothetical protein
MSDLREESLLRYYDNIPKQVEVDKGNKHKFMASASIKEYAELLRLEYTNDGYPTRPNHMTMIAPAVIQLFLKRRPLKWRRSNPPKRYKLVLIQ